jgi:hypothetical protein
MAFSTRPDPSKQLATELFPDLALLPLLCAETEFKNLVNNVTLASSSTLIGRQIDAEETA